MKKLTISAVGILLVLAFAWAAFGEAGGGGGGGGGARFAAMREAQQKAVADLQEQVAKLKTLMQPPAGMQGRNFQDMSEEERTKMREEGAKRREEQQKVYAAIDQDLARLKGVRGLIQENEQATAPLKDILATAQKENAKETVAKVQKLLADQQKKLEDQATAMGMTADQLQQMQERMRNQ